MDIFANIDTARTQVRQQFLKCRDLLLGLVATVINNNIERRNISLKVSPELSILLIANVDRHRLAFICLTCAFDVYAIKSRAPKYSCHICKLPPLYMPTSSARKSLPMNLFRCLWYISK